MCRLPRKARRPDILLDSFSRQGRGLNSPLGGGFQAGSVVDVSALQSMTNINQRGPTWVEVGPSWTKLVRDCKAGHAFQQAVLESTLQEPCLVRQRGQGQGMGRGKGMSRGKAKAEQGLGAQGCSGVMVFICL